MRAAMPEKLDFLDEEWQAKHVFQRETVGFTVGAYGKDQLLKGHLDSKGKDMERGEGKGSPVKLDSSTVLLPALTIPSAGIRSSKGQGASGMKAAKQQSLFIGLPDLYKTPFLIDCYMELRQLSSLFKIPSQQNKCNQHNRFLKECFPALHVRKFH
nr:hypothetical protein Iba_chr14fCG1620 [Ipomoea batatas]